MTTTDITYKWLNRYYGDLTPELVDQGTNRVHVFSNTSGKGFSYDASKSKVYDINTDIIPGIMNMFGFDITRAFDCLHQFISLRYGIAVKTILDILSQTFGREFDCGTKQLQTTILDDIQEIRQTYTYLWHHHNRIYPINCRQTQESQASQVQVEAKHGHEN